ncbi:hypothetical protein F511_13638 [Dorcoceras hygrometricum]|uniref:RING-type domain-containing protein n=1 Tax=Dorcoceras hygrometricum TaxID=472368 RepID=A0A2Z7AJ44_9LAMI|nr:hypothetical protein F511_13638 [Dorcoceras hygrometricum]
MEERQMLEIDTRVDLELPEHRINGLEPVIVDAIPTMNFNHEAFGSAEDAQCTICLSEYQEKEVLRIMPSCGHSFHLSCIDTWLRKQSTCPVCRLSVQSSFDTKHLRTATLSTTQPFNSHAESIEHSRQRHEDSTSIDVESGITGDARLR